MQTLAHTLVEGHVGRIEMRESGEGMWRGYGDGLRGICCTESAAIETKLGMVGERAL